MKNNSCKNESDFAVVIKQSLKITLLRTTVGFVSDFIRQARGSLSIAQWITAKIAMLESATVWSVANQVFVSQKNAALRG